MDLDAAEEKMLRAIVQTAVASAAAGRSFVGEFRRYRISGTCLQVNESGVARVAVRIRDSAGPVDDLFQGTILVDRWDPA